MRWTMAVAALLVAVPANAQTGAVDSAVYLERDAGGETRVEPAVRLERGDRVVTILRWDMPRRGNYTITSRVPPSLTLRSASHPGLEVSTDSGLTWQRPRDPDRIPDGATHLRWQANGEGRLSYRAIVR